MNVTGIIQDDWAHEPSVRDACLHVWTTLASQPEYLDHYTFDDLRQFAKQDDPSVLSQALLYLSNPKLKILKTCLMYEFNGSFLELPDEEVDRYSRGEVVIHPEYGEPLDEADILVCFIPGAALHQKGSP